MSRPWSPAAPRGPKQIDFFTGLVSPCHATIFFFWIQIAIRALLPGAQPPCGTANAAPPTPSVEIRSTQDAVDFLTLSLKSAFSQSLISDGGACVNSQLEWLGRMWSQTPAAPASLIGSEVCLLLTHWTNCASLHFV